LSLAVVPAAELCRFAPQVSQAEEMGLIERWRGQHVAAANDLAVVFEV